MAFVVRVVFPLTWFSWSTFFVWRGWRFLIVALLAFMLLACEAEHPATDRMTIAEGLVSLNNKGVGEMGHFDYQAAYLSFSRLVTALPDSSRARLNLAIALLNRQQAGDEEQALGMVRELTLSVPSFLSAHYVVGILEFNRGELVAARSAFEAVLAADPGDAYASYFLAQINMQERNLPQAVELYRRSIRSDPYLRSAYYGEFQALQRSGDKEGARKSLAGYQRLDKNPRARLAELKYTRMGPRAEALPFDQVARQPTSRRPVGDLFGKREVIAASLMQKQPDRNNVTVVDMNQDGTLDIYLPGVQHPNGSQNTLLFGADTGYRPAAPEHVLAAAPGVVAAAWGDYDNDGRVDVYLVTKSGHMLMHNTADHGWIDETSSSGTGMADAPGGDAFFVDADHDGDLDLLLLSAKGVPELLNNNLDGTFRRLAAKQGLQQPGQFYSQVLAGDLDGDRDTDLLLIGQDGGNRVMLNDRLWQYHEQSDAGELAQANLSLAVLADLDINGLPEIYAADASGALVRWQNDGGDGWERTELLDNISGSSLSVLDVDGDAAPELIIGGEHGLFIWRASAHSDMELLWSARGPSTGVTHLNGFSKSGPGLLVLQDGELALYPPAKGRFEFVLANFSGRTDEGDSMRSNASGIGTLLYSRMAADWGYASTFRNSSGLGNSLQSQALGLAGHASLDFLAIHWSDGVYQTELGLKPGETTIVETQRQLASCPVVFAWDGEKYRFVSDILGVGGIGFAVAPGVYAEPRPHERLLMPTAAMVAQDGRFKIKVSEPMEETAYLDQVQLLVYDLPEEQGILLDERMGTGAPEPTGEVFAYSELMLPTHALDQDGRDQRELVIERDLRAADPGPRDHRFVGLLAQKYSLLLEFDEPIDPLRNPVLIIDGWLEYGYSQTSFAAWQAGKEFMSPSLEVKTPDGWQMLLPTFGYPAGMPRRASVPLQGLSQAVSAIRLTTNQEIYWDFLAIAYVEAALKSTKAIRPSLARVAKTGFPLRRSGSQRVPEYDYATRNPFWDTRYMRGQYTNLGGALPLVMDKDNALAIIGAGEELHLEFSADLPPVPAGFRRWFVLDSHGWAKDMDLYTRDGETVGPLPADGPLSSTSAELNQLFNTRFQSGI